MKIYNLKVTYEQIGDTEDNDQFTSAAQAVRYMKGAFDEYPNQEQFFVIALNGANRPIFRKMITLGIANATQIHARECFAPCILSGAVSVIIAHNHPSGSTRPSPEDIETTKRLVEAGKILDIPVLDHLIISGDGWNSLKAIHPYIF